jgi:hypothetical protein
MRRGWPRTVTGGTSAVHSPETTMGTIYLDAVDVRSWPIPTLAIARIRLTCVVTNCSNAARQVANTNIVLFEGAAQFCVDVQCCVNLMSGREVEWTLSTP